MNRTEIRREGLTGARPGRESRTWSGEGTGGGGREPHDHPGTSYYGDPIINEPVWRELNIAGYLFAGGLAGASSVLAAGADISGRETLARSAKLTASGAIAVSLAFLIHDLGRPARFLNMMRVFKPTSPMSVGTWILAAYTPLAAAASASDVLELAPRSGRVAGLGAGILGPAVCTYTAALISNTAVPAWHEAWRELPFVFAGSAASAAGGAALLGAPCAQAAPARRLGVLGALAELSAVTLLERRRSAAVEPYREGLAGRRLRASKVLTAAGALGAATVASRSRSAAALSGAALVAGSALSRFGIFQAGMASARDPRYTVDPQRERLRDGDSAS